MFDMDASLSERLSPVVSQLDASVDDLRRLATTGGSSPPDRRDPRDPGG